MLGVVTLEWPLLLSRRAMWQLRHPLKDLKVLL